ncbi:MAG: hypothetical protein COA57_12625, partial [Flavobacteriales bacterium]
TEGKEVEIEGRGRHDPCVLPRAVPIVEAMGALVICDHMMRIFANNITDSVTYKRILNEPAGK